MKKKLVIQDDTKHKCECGNQSTVKFKTIRNHVKSNSGYLCDTCFVKTVKEALELD